MPGLDWNTVIAGGVIVALIAQIGLIVKSTTTVLEFLEKHFVSKSDYNEHRLQAEKDEATRKEWVVRHVEERAEHKAAQATTAMLSKFQSLEDKIGMWMENRKERDDEHYKIFTDVQTRLHNIELSCAGHPPKQGAK